MALIQWSDFLFNIDTLTYDELRRKSSVRWARQKIVGGNERLQAVGRDNDTIRLKGVFYPQVASWVAGTVGTQSLDDLRAEMKQMQPKLITLANGTSLGYWVLEEVDVDNSNYSGGTGHVPRRQKFDLKFRFYGDRL